MKFCVTFTTIDFKSKLPTGSVTCGDGDSDDNTTLIIEVVLPRALVASLVDEIVDKVAKKLAGKATAQKKMTMIMTLMMMMKLVIYRYRYWYQPPTKLITGKKNSTSSPNLWACFVLEQVTTIIIRLHYCNRPSLSVPINSL